MRLAAHAIVLVHNHPTGDPHPSQADVSLTLQVLQACRVVGVQVLDHLVIAENGHVSLVEAGKMPRLLEDMAAYPIAGSAKAGRPRRVAARQS